MKFVSILLIILSLIIGCFAQNIPVWVPFMTSKRYLKTDSLAIGTISFDSPGANGTYLTSDGSGGFSWTSGLTNPGYWAMSANLLYPTTLTYKVGIGHNNPSRYLHVYDPVSYYPARFQGVSHTKVEYHARVHAGIIKRGSS